MTEGTLPGKMGNMHNLNNIARKCNNMEHVYPCLEQQETKQESSLCKNGIVTVVC